jgi:hypothetical protein
MQGVAKGARKNNFANFFAIPDLTHGPLSTQSRTVHFIAADSA